MARPKLSKEKKKRLRDQLIQQQRKGTPVADIVRRASKTFGIAGETVRYHLKRVNGVKRIKRTHNDLLLFGKTARMTVQDDKGVVLSGLSESSLGFREGPTTIFTLSS